jgi:hypothetical protein
VLQNNDVVGEFGVFQAVGDDDGDAAGDDGFDASEDLVFAA